MTLYDEIEEDLVKKGFNISYKNKCSQDLKVKI